jgi:hypothetical protein
MGKAVWRIDAIWPDDPNLVANYIPLKWDGTRWFSKELEAGGQPAVSVADGAVEFSVRAPWTGQPGQRTAALAFIVPETGTWRITGKASSKPWTGEAATYKLGVFKKDTQRSAQQAVIELPRSGEALDLNVKVDLTAGHELILLPLMPDWHNATTTRVVGLMVERVVDRE